MKKIFALLTALIVAITPLSVNAAKTEETKEDLVKVYIFEAGGCPYCEAEVEYLEGLKSYNKKFTIVRKELYVDHINWAKGKDYDLGKKVAETFLAAGFSDASYQGTPFVVISDLYAAASYSESLEAVIDEAYEKGDADIVNCIAKGNENCLTIDEKTSSSDGHPWLIICTGAILAIIYIVKSNSDRDKILEALKK